MKKTGNQPVFSEEHFAMLSNQAAQQGRTQCLRWAARQGLGNFRTASTRANVNFILVWASSCAAKTMRAISLEVGNGNAFEFFPFKEFFGVFEVRFVRAYAPNA